MILYKKLIRKCCHLNVHRQLNLTIQNLLIKDQEQIEKDSFINTLTKKNISVSKEVCNHLKSINLENSLSFLPKKFLRKNSQTKVLYLINYDVANQLCSIISKDLLENASFVIECNPGLGFLTKELLNIGIPKINLYEKIEQFFKPDSPLSKILIKYKERIILKKLNFFDIWMTMLYDDFYCDNYSEKFLFDVPIHKWTDKTFGQIITINGNKSFLTLLIHNFFKQTRIFNNGRATFYMVIPSKVWMRLTVNNTDLKNIRFYSHYNVILHLFFEYKCLGELPRNAFIPWPLNKSKKDIDELNDPMLVIKLEPKINTFNLIKKEELVPFWFFLKYCLRSIKNKIIAEFEKLIPGCGPKLIQYDINICTNFKELSPEKLLEIFKDFKTWPEYDEYLFIPTTARSSEEAKKEDETEEDLEHESGINSNPSIDNTVDKK